MSCEACEDGDLSQPAAKRSKITEGNPPALSISDQLLAIERTMCEELSQIQFSVPVTHIYNPLEYAAETHRCYISRYGNSRKRVLFMGMNPGPFGMAQNGVGIQRRIQWNPLLGTPLGPGEVSCIVLISGAFF